MVRRVDSPDAHDSEDESNEEAKAEMAPLLSLPGEPAATVEYINAAHEPVDIMDVKHKQSAFIRLESDDPVTSAEAVLDASAIASYGRPDDDAATGAPPPPAHPPACCP